MLPVVKENQRTSEQWQWLDKHGHGKHQTVMIQTQDCVHGQMLCQAQNRWSFNHSQDCSNEPWSPHEYIASHCLWANWPKTNNGYGPANDMAIERLHSGQQRAIRLHKFGSTICSAITINHLKYSHWPEPCSVMRKQCPNKMQDKAFTIKQSSCWIQMVDSVEHQKWRTHFVLDSSA